MTEDQADHIIDFLTLAFDNPNISFHKMPNLDGFPDHYYVALHFNGKYTYGPMDWYEFMQSVNKFLKVGTRDDINADL